MTAADLAFWGDDYDKPDRTDRCVDYLFFIIALIAFLLYAATTPAAVPAWDPAFKREAVDCVDARLQDIYGYPPETTRALAQCWADWVEPQVDQASMGACLGVGATASEKCPWSTVEFIRTWVRPALKACS